MADTLQFDVPDHWVVLRVRAERSKLVADYRDSRGRRLKFASGAEWKSTELFQSPDPVRVHGAVPFHMVDLIETLPRQRVGPHANHEVPLPVFLDTPAGIDPMHLGGNPRLPARWPLADRIQLIDLARRRWQARPDLRLPIRVLGIGPLAAASLKSFRKRPWLLDEPVDRHGLEIRTIAANELDSNATFDRDIVIADRAEAAAIVEWRRSARSRDRAPRLVIAFADANLSHDPGLPAGMSELIVDPGLARRFVSEFLYGMVHDFPIHEAMRSAAGTRSIGVRLYSDPVANQELRLSTALATMLREAREIEDIVPGAAIQQLVTRLAAGSTPGVDFGDSARRLRDGVQELFDLRGDFAQERTGLLPMSSAAMALEAARSEAVVMRDLLGDVAADPKGRASLTEQQQRVVDITLERLEYTPLANDLYSITAAGTLWVDDRTVLRAGARYRLLVNIGKKSSTSLVHGDVPPILPLLPGGPRHELEVAVFGLDFRVIGRRIRTVTLPELGPSDVADFTIRAPRIQRGQEGGVARLRVAVYHKNHLVQSFGLSALVELDERTSEPGTLAVTLETSRSARFTNVDKLQPRKISIGINEGPRGTHRLTVKRGRTASDFTYGADAAAPVVEAFRKRLHDATYRDQAPRYPAGEPVDAEGRAEFEATIRDLATQGWNLWNGLIGRAPASLGQVFADIANSATTTIQVIRHEVTSVVPWSIMYDYAVPEVPVGAAPPQVCVGWGPGKDPDGAPKKHCDHGPEVPGFCIYGFWGIRYVIEELLPEAPATDPTFEVTPVPNQASMLLAADVDTDQAVVRLTGALTKLLAPSRLGTLKATDKLVDVLWDAQLRPPMLVVVGHHATQNVVGQVSGSRIAMPGGAFLRPNDLTSRRARSGQWTKPNTVALLMACGTATTTPATVNDFVIALNAAGAAAIVGTEVAIFTGLAERFASEVATSMWSPGRPTLGDAIRSFRVDLATSFNPLAFAFTGYGSADIYVGH